MSFTIFTRSDEMYAVYFMAVPLDYDLIDLPLLNRSEALEALD